MKQPRRFGLIVVLLGVLAGALAFVAWRSHSSAGAARTPAENASASDRASSEKLPPPANLLLHVGAGDWAAEALLDPAASAWKDAAPTKVLLNRTPRIYQTEPPFTGTPPACEVRGLRTGDRLLLRLQWTDATRDAPTAPERKTGEGGDAAKLYKRPTGETSAFADAAAVMLPQKWSGGPFPSLVMGDRSTPVRLFYWNASRGAEELSATGRATPEPTGKTFAHRAAYADGRWTLTAELPAPPDGCPIAFAVWDGSTGDRDGLKFFSIWYVLALEK
jgi:complex iron-sulfur molybdoenzyme family reductase subunit gamma